MPDEQEITVVDPPVSLASTEQLLDELVRRYPVCVFSGLRECLGDSAAQERLTRWFGCSPTAIGLLEITKKKIINQLFEDAEPIDDDDD